MGLARGGSARRERRSNAAVLARGDYPLARNSAGPGTRQQGEDGESPRLRQRAGERFALAVDGEAA